MANFNEMIIGVSKGQTWTREAWSGFGDKPVRKLKCGYIKPDQINSYTRVFHTRKFEGPFSYRLSFEDYDAKDWKQINKESGR